MSVNRRRFLQVAGAGALGLAVRGLARAAGAGEQRPNILYVFTDQQFAEALSGAGNPWVKTPAMDSLAANGVRFDRAYCTHPFCSPSRASMLTGLMPHEHGVVTNGMAIRQDVERRQMGWIFREAGYDCAYAGKGHLPTYNGLNDTHGFDVLCNIDEGKVTSQCVAFLGKKREKPFLLVASYHQPHDICSLVHVDEPTQSKSYRGKPTVPLEEFTRPCPLLPANFDPPSPVPGVADRFSTGKWSHDTWRRYLYGYYRMVEEVDGRIGQVLKALRDAGLEEKTLIVFSSDHGDGLGAHHASGKECFYEQAMRIPMIVSFKGRTRPRAVDETHLVSNGLDLLPTLCDYAGVAPPPGLRGRSLRPPAEGRETPNWRDQVVAVCRRGTGHMVRTQRYKYASYGAEGGEQLFDLQQDPGEVRNLLDDPSAKDVLADHRKRLADWRSETGFDKVPAGGPGTRRRKAKSSP
ncbi:MAG: sulfatase-like hydrolase/transferase [Planctomycetes bacterium]|nr:sulfatase-like hydrolase/transferase [Planctomycetota bacterium]